MASSCHKNRVLHIGLVKHLGAHNRIVGTKCSQPYTGSILRRREFWEVPSCYSICFFSSCNQTEATEAFAQS